MKDEEFEKYYEKLNFCFRNIHTLGDFYSQKIADKSKKEVKEILEEIENNADNEIRFTISDGRKYVWFNP